MNDWQRARPISLHDPLEAHYDPIYYLGKIDDWIERYGKFLGVSAPAKGSDDRQGELL